MKKLPKLHLICSDDQFRPVMNFILLTKDEVCATDGTILVVHKTKDLFDAEFITNMPDRCLIHKTQWRGFCNGFDSIRLDAGNLEVIQKFTPGYQYSILYRLTLEKPGFMYPNYKEVMNLGANKIKINSIGLNADRFNRLLSAMFLPSEVKNVKLSFFGANQAIIIHPTNIKTIVTGLVMPIMIPE